MLSAKRLALVVFLLSLVSAAAVAFFYRQGWLLYYGDAEAHLNIARRIIDSRTPNYDQIGTVWLPLPHVLMLPFVRDDRLWRTGLAGSIPSAACFVLAGALLFLATQRVLRSTAAAAAAAAVFALNPNLLYLQSTAMGEPVFFAALLGLLYCTVWFQQSQSVLAVLGAALASLAASLTRYEGWLLVPFATLFFFLAARKRRVFTAALFGFIAALGPLYWLAHNRWFYGNALEFYNGPYSAKAIAAGTTRYDWLKACRYFLAAARLCVGAPLAWLGLAGAIAALLKRAVWPLVLLALPALFYVASIHFAITPIHVPHLWPNSYYNTRYGLAVLPWLAFASAGLVAVAPARIRPLAAIVAIVIAIAPWIGYPRQEAWICWKESQVNSEARRAWTREAADYLRARYHGGGIFTSFGDLCGIFRQAGIPLRDTLNDCNAPHWDAAVMRPDLFLWDEWVVAISYDGDKISGAIRKLERDRRRYECVRMVAVKGAPIVRIYRRENSVHQGARRQK